VTHSFLEVGHTQNENDSIHSAIERAARKAKIYTPEQWSAVARTARQNKPYSVQDMQLVDFINFKEVAKEIRNFDVTDAGCKVNWSKLRSIRFSKAEPNIMLVKHSHGDDYARVDLMRRKRNVTSAADVQLPQLRTTGLHLSAAKYKDLSVLCAKNLIPPAYSAIERAARKAKIYTPEQWSAVARTARQNKPYSVQDMQLVDFINFKEVAKEIRNFDVTDAGCKVNWSKLRSIRFSKAEPNIMLVKHSHGDDYARVDLMRRKRNVTSAADVQLPQLRTTGLHLSAAKYKDLSVLCAKNLIPPAYHPFFQALPHDDTA